MADAGEKVTDLETRVRPEPHLLFHWSAFVDLSTDRQMGFGVGPIPWSALDMYARRYGLDDPDEFDRFKRLVRALDGTFLAWHTED